MKKIIIRLFFVFFAVQAVHAMQLNPAHQAEALLFNGQISVEDYLDYIESARSYGASIAQWKASNPEVRDHIAKQIQNAVNSNTRSIAQAAAELNASMPLFVRHYNKQISESQ